MKCSRIVAELVRRWGCIALLAMLVLVAGPCLMALAQAVPPVDAEAPAAGLAAAVPSGQPDQWMFGMFWLVTLVASIAALVFAVKFFK